MENKRKCYSLIPKIIWLGRDKKDRYESKTSNPRCRFSQRTLRSSFFLFLPVSTRKRERRGGGSRACEGQCSLRGNLCTVLNARRALSLPTLPQHAKVRLSLTLTRGARRYRKRRWEIRRSRGMLTKRGRIDEPYFRAEGLRRKNTWLSRPLNPRKVVRIVFRRVSTFTSR